MALEAQLQVSDATDLPLHDSDRSQVAGVNFYRDFWKPTQEASCLDIRPHECRHPRVANRGFLVGPVFSRQFVSDDRIDLCVVLGACAPPCGFVAGGRERVVAKLG